MCLTEPRGIRRAALSGNLAWQNSCFRQKMSFRRIVVEATEVCVKGSGLLGSCRGESCSDKAQPLVIVVSPHGGSHASSSSDQRSCVSEARVLKVAGLAVAFQPHTRGRIQEELSRSVRGKVPHSGAGCTWRGRMTGYSAGAAELGRKVPAPVPHRVCPVPGRDLGALRRSGGRGTPRLCVGRNSTRPVEALPAVPVWGRAGHRRAEDGAGFTAVGHVVRHAVKGFCQLPGTLLCHTLRGVYKEVQ